MDGRHSRRKQVTDNGRQVFSSRTGLRGTILAILFVVTLFSAVMGVGLVGRLTAALPAQAMKVNSSVEYPQQIAHQMAACAKHSGGYDDDGTKQVPIIGQGMFQRVVRVVHDGATSYAVDLFDGRVLGQLTQLEMHATRVCRYAVQQYGVVPKKTITMTYDDGPDARWTPQILNALDAYGVKATFFTIGENNLKNQALFRRMIADGQDVGNHTYDHPLLTSLDPAAARAELVKNARIMAYVGHLTSDKFRTPYGGGDRRDIEHNAYATIVAQQLGFVEVGLNEDTFDYDAGKNKRLPTPIFDGRGSLVLMHDGGGVNRSQTVDLTIRTIQQAVAHGYQILTVEQLMHRLHIQPQAAQNVHAHVTLADTLGYWEMWGPQLVLHNILTWLMLGATILTGLANLTMCLIALWSRWWNYRRLPDWCPKIVTIVISCLMEAESIGATIEALFQSDYPGYVEIVAVDDGSRDYERRKHPDLEPQDRTWDVLQELERQYRRRHKRFTLKVYTKPNSGKSNTLNAAFFNEVGQEGLRTDDDPREIVRGEVAVGIDADTLVAPTFLARIVRHFADPAMGVVTGRVDADGNFGTTVLQQILGRFQAEEYRIGVAVPRECQNGLNAVQIISGACWAAFTKNVRDVGGFHTDTLAEDTDLGWLFHKKYLKVRQDLTAVVFTQVPLTIRQLTGQWRRWTYGIYQAMYKHRDVLVRARYGKLSLMMWYSVISVVVPTLVLPYNYFRFGQALFAGNWKMVVVYFTVFTVYRFMVCLLAMVILREWSWNILLAVLYRFTNDPLQFYIAYRTWFAMFTGQLVPFFRPNRHKAPASVASAPSLPAAGLNDGEPASEPINA